MDEGRLAHELVVVVPQDIRVWSRAKDRPPNAEPNSRREADVDIQSDAHRLTTRSSPQSTTSELRVRHPDQTRSHPRGQQ